MIPTKRAFIGSGVTLILLVGLAGCGNGTPRGEASKSATSTTKVAPTAKPATTTTSTTAPCPLSSSSGAAVTVPVNQVCGSAGAPYFETPDSAMTYLSTAWNTGNVQELDYVTDPAGRQEMDSMATQMVNLQFKNCTENPAGDYTCYFDHDVTPTDSPTTYPNPSNYPAGEAVFTVAPAAASGWYLTNVIHCG
jgi:hypothetical protein